METTKTDREVYRLPDCADCGTPVSMTDRIGHDPEARHRWCAEARWNLRLSTNEEAEKADRERERDAWGGSRCAVCHLLIRTKEAEWAGESRCVCLVPSPPSPA